MPSLLAALPGQEQKEQLLNSLAVVCDPQQLGLASLQSLAVTHLLTAIPTVTWPAWPPLPTVPTPAAIYQQLQMIVSQLQTLEGIITLDSAGLLPPPPPPVTLAAAINNVATALLPWLPPPAALDLPEAVQALLASSGLAQLLVVDPALADAPLWQRLDAHLHTVTSVATKLGDPAYLAEFATQQVQAHYRALIKAVDVGLPLVALEQALACCSPPTANNRIGAVYQQLLDELAGLTEPSPEQIGQWRATLAEVTAALQTLVAADQTLAALQANAVQPFATTVAQLVTPASAAASPYQPLFDQWAPAAGQWLAAVGATLPQFPTAGDALRAAADPATELAQQIEALLTEVDQVLAASQAGLLALITPVETLVTTVDLAPLVELVKVGGAQVSAAVDHCLTLLEEVKGQLDQGVAYLQTQVDTQVTTALQAVESQLRALLKLITDLLTHPDVQAVFTQVRQWVEKFTRVVEQTTLKPVFDLVLTKTSALESDIKAIPVAQLGLPQRTALKAGVQIIKEVRVDELIKPTLLDLFAQICTPVTELLALVNEKVLLLEAAVYTFNPGTLAQELVESTGPYQQLIAMLDAFRPSQILAPLQELNATLTTQIAQFDPNQWLPPLQTLYAELAALLTVLDPAGLSAAVQAPLTQPLAQLSALRDQVAALLPALGPSAAEPQPTTADIPLASATAIGTQLLTLLRGDALAAIESALEQAETGLAQTPSDASDLLAHLATVLANIDRQQAATTDSISSLLSELHLGLAATDWAVLQGRQTELLLRPDLPPISSQLLQRLDLQPVLQLQATVRALLDLTADEFTTRLTALTATLPEPADALQQFTAATLASTAPLLFRQLVGDPARQLLAQVRSALEPLAPTVADLQAWLTASSTGATEPLTPSTAPPDPAHMLELLDATLATMADFGATCAAALQPSYTHLCQQVAQLSPVWLLNVFGAPDFVAEPASASATPAGLVRMATRIARGEAEGDLHLAALLQSQLTTDELARLQGELGSTPPATLSQPTCALVYAALNRLLGAGQALPASDVAAIQANLQTLLDAASATISNPQLTAAEQLAANQRRYRLLALQTQLTTSANAYQNSQQPPDLLRWQRVLLEAAYPDDLALSLPSLYPYLVTQVAQLYPEQTIQRLDALYAGLVAQVRQLPDQLIRAPLDDAFNAVTTILQENFDLSGLFALLLRKVAGLDSDLATGLNRLSTAYNRLVRTCDQRLGAKG